MISKAAAAPYDARTAATVVGTSWKDAVFITTSRHSSSRARVSPRRTMPLAARIPAGVAALPRPRRFALTFSDRAAMTALSCPLAGNRRMSTGRSRRESHAAAPLRSKSSATALHRHTAPPIEMQKLTAAPAPSSTALPACAALPLYAA